MRALSESPARSNIFLRLITPQGGNTLRILKAVELAIPADVLTASIGEAVRFMRATTAPSVAGLVFNIDAPGTARLLLEREYVPRSSAIARLIDVDDLVGRISEHLRAHLYKSRPRSATRRSAYLPAGTAA